MKKTILSVSLLAAIVASACANAEIVNKTTDDIEFNGYFRMGGLFSIEDDLKKAKYPAQKETLGRLGIESDNWAEIALSKIFKLSNGNEIKIRSTAGNDVHRVQNQLGTSDDPSTIGFLENYVELKGATESGTIWAGRRYYGKDQLIFMTDFFYTDWSGTGIGVEAYEIGDMKFDLGYLFSDRTHEDLSYWSDANNMMHTLHTSVSKGSFELHAVAKYLPDNFDIDGNKWSENGFELAGMYTPSNYFGLGNGFSKIAIQAGKGLGSGQLLGGTFTNYNAYKPGRLANGNDAKGQINIAKVADDDMSYRAVAYGGYFFENGLQIFTSLQGQYNDLDNGRTETWISAMARPVLPITDSFKLVSEIGYVNNSVTEAKNDYWGAYDNNDVYKLSIAPTWTLDTGLGPAPELRLLATYLSDSGTNAGDSDIILGAQVDVWW